MLPWLGETSCQEPARCSSREIVCSSMWARDLNATSRRPLPSPRNTGDVPKTSSARQTTNNKQHLHSPLNAMPNLDMLLLKGPSPRLEEGLNELRFAILADGIPANSEGMVRLHNHGMPLRPDTQSEGPLSSEHLQLLYVPY